MADRRFDWSIALAGYALVCLGLFSLGMQIADLPGIYSLSANSDEEIITRDNIAGGAVANINELLVTNVAKPEALAFIFAITFNMPCIVALAATYQETQSQ